ncbi:L-dopachrome tautomerase-related protein [Rhizosaccharibacter radicis]|uniref:Major royal jelly family protein n=1 Tax=Rhizosaccharibacter radicis TaxID=2782605 RepID=A0ABT1VXJ4_9PROT|nr:major royal jelly family protein [Acetobacteraceae bacterium KSS12]
MAFAGLLVISHPGMSSAATDVPADVMPLLADVSPVSIAAAAQSRDGQIVLITSPRDDHGAATLQRLVGKELHPLLPAVAPSSNPGSGNTEAAGKGGASAPASPPPPPVDPASLRLASDGALWVVDDGPPGGKAPPASARLLRIDADSGQVADAIPLPPEMLRPHSRLGPLRFHKTHAYVADIGAPGLLVVDLSARTVRRVLDDAPELSSRRPVEAKSAHDPTLSSIPMEVSPDGAWLFIQPEAGPLVRLPTALLDDPETSAATLSAGIVFWFDTPAATGSAMMPDGTLLLDTRSDGLLALSADRTLTPLLRDPRLAGDGTPFLRNDNKLLVPGVAGTGDGPAAGRTALFLLDPAALRSAARRVAGEGTAQGTETAPGP